MVCSRPSPIIRLSWETSGAAHPGTFHMAFCDGHVEGVSYDIDLLVHQNNANRRDEGATKTR